MEPARSSALQAHARLLKKDIRFYDTWILVRYLIHPEAQQILNALAPVPQAIKACP